MVLDHIHIDLPMDPKPSSAPISWKLLSLLVSGNVHVHQHDAFQNSYRAPFVEESTVYVGRSPTSGAQCPQ